jgi:hypothetical protein
MFVDQIDFRFLSEDLDDEQGFSKPLDDILKDIEKNSKKSKRFQIRNFILNNFKKTDFNIFYSEVTKDQDRFAKIQSKQELIQKCVENHNVKGIIRVHVVLPSKGESCKDFIAGVRMVKNMLI